VLLAGLLLIDRPAAVMAQEFRDLFNGRDLAGWVNVNTADDTWRVKDGVLTCSGRPIGVMRSEKQYENETLGHSQVSLTLNTYSHVLPALHHDAAARMNAVFTGS
jgi:hypothetical protein